MQDLELKKRTRIILFFSDPLKQIIKWIKVSGKAHTGVDK